MQKVIVLDFGGQYNQLIVRRVREAGVYCEILPCDAAVDSWADETLAGVILTGGPQSVYDPHAKYCDPKVLQLGVPVLGICYGQQWLAHQLGGNVGPMRAREYGATQTTFVTTHPLFDGVESPGVVWMNHNDGVTEMPQGMTCLAHTENCAVAAMGDDTRRIYAVQFHPEVAHTVNGSKILSNFLYHICHCQGGWKMDAVVDSMVAAIREQVGDRKVLCGLSGGVDSSVAAVLVHRAIGDNLTCVFVDHGLLRKDEGDQVMETFSKNLGLHIVRADAGPRFLAKLAGVTDPEQKRKIIGHEFITVFQEEAKKIGAVDFLVQGTIYPDVIESGMGQSAVIKSHHNVGGLPANVGFGLVEPLRLLFKDEVRALGEALGIPHDMVWRQPFPGPGLAIRILGDITEEKLHIVRESDAILREEIANAGLQEQIWQYFTVFTPLRTVGVMGDERTYDHVLAIRAVTSTDAMTVEAAEIPYPLLKKIMNRIINEVPGVNRVVYDITSKPPGTIEWE